MSDFQTILFIGNPPQESLRALLDNFGHEDMLTTYHCEQIGADDSKARTLVDTVWPDLICLFADDLEAKGEDVIEFCAQVREHVMKARPILIVQSGSTEEQRIQYLIQGADDILGADLSAEEFRIRLLVHLRRNLDMATHEITRLPGLQFTSKVVQRRLNQHKPVAVLIVEIDHLGTYAESYGDLPLRQVLKTFAALLSHLILMPDFISHTDENHFVIVTNPDKAEKMAALLCRQFETVSPNFYSEKDRKQGYMVSVIANNISRRVPLLCLNIGIASTETQPFDSFLSLFNTSQQMKSLARLKPGNGWQSDRLRLAGSSMPEARRIPGILVLEPDAALAFLLKITLEMEGYEVEAVNNLEDARQSLSEQGSRQGLDLVILDALINEQEGGLQLAVEIHERYPEISLICTSSLHNRQRVLQAGADLYLPKPFELSSLFSWIRRLLEDRP